MREDCLGVETCAVSALLDIDRAVVCLTRGQSIGLVMDVAAGFISLVALLGAFTLLFVSRGLLVVDMQQY